MALLEESCCHVEEVKSIVSLAGSALLILVLFYLVARIKCAEALTLGVAVGKLCATTVSKAERERAYRVVYLVSRYICTFVHPPFLLNK